MDSQQAGRNLRDFLTGFLGHSGGNTDSTSTSVTDPDPWSNKGVPPDSGSVSTPGYDPNRIVNNMPLAKAVEPYDRLAASGVGLNCNHAARLIPGHFLVVYNEKVYILDPNKGTFLFAFHLERKPRAFLRMAIANADGQVFCSMSGAAEEVPPVEYASFGHWGAVLRVDIKKGEIKSICDGQFIDPFGLQLLPNNKLLVADFNGWGGGGTTYLVDLNTEQKTVLATGGHYVDPESAFIDKRGDLWVANSMHRNYDGSIVKVSKGQQTVVVPPRGYGSGILCSVHPSNKEDRLVGYVIDWPHMAGSAIFHVDKKSGAIDYIRNASVENPAIFGPHGDVVDNLLWVGDSYQGEIVAINLDSKEIVHRIDASPIKGAVKGVYDSFDFIETVSVIPKQNAPVA